MRNLNGSWIISVLCGIVAAMAVSFFAPVCLADEPNSEAQKFMDAMSPEQFADPVALDNFIRRFPDSIEARIAFAYRYSLLEQMPTIEGYNDFIDKYPEKLQAQIAVHEVFKLYQAQDRVVGYYDFLSRYPNTPQAIVAIMRIQELLFEYACVLDEEEEYDAFISAFPDAPQVNAALEKAKQKAIIKEQALFDEFKKKNNVESDEALDNNIQLMGDLNEKVNQWFSEVEPLQEVNLNLNSSEDIDNQLKLYKIKRRADVLRNVYGRYNPVKDISIKLDNLSIMKRLDAIKQTIDKNHQELLAKLDEDTDRICQGLTLLHYDNQQLIKELRNGFQVLHNVIVDVYKQLEKANLQLMAINYNIQEFHRTVYHAFNRLDLQLERANQNLINVRNTVAEGFSAQSQILVQGFNNLNDTVSKGFNASINQMQMINKNMIRGFDQIGEKLDINNYQLQSINSNVVRGFYQTVKGLDNISETIDRNTEATLITRDDMIKGFGSVNNNIVAHGQRITSSLDNIGIELRNIDSHIQDKGSVIANQINKTGTAIADQIKETDNSIQDANRNLINLDNNLRNGIEAQSRLAMLSLIEQRQNAQQLNNQSKQLKELRAISLGGFSDVENNMRAQNELLNRMQARSDSLSKGENFLVESIAMTTGAMAGKIATVILTPVTGPYAPFIGAGLGVGYGEFCATNLKELATSHKGNVEDIKNEAVFAVFQEDKVRILNAAKKLSDKEIPAELQNKILISRNSDNLRDSIEKLSEFCGVKPSALTYAARHVY